MGPQRQPRARGDGQPCPALGAARASKLADARHDRAADHLPASADSTRVAEPEDRLPGGETTELVLVHPRDAD